MLDLKLIKKEVKILAKYEKTRININITKTTDKKQQTKTKTKDQLFNINESISMINIKDQ